MMPSTDRTTRTSWRLSRTARQAMQVLCGCLLGLLRRIFGLLGRIFWSLNRNPESLVVPILPTTARAAGPALLARDNATKALIVR